MEITGKQIIPATPQRVWDALNDPEILKICLPGCETVEQVSSDEFKVIIKTVIGPLRARFQGSLKLTESNPPSSCIMIFEGQGGAVGFGKGSSLVELTQTPEGCALTYSAKAQIGGKLAQVGNRLIDSVVKKMADDFFKVLKEQVAPASTSKESPSQSTSKSGLTSTALGSSQSASGAKNGVHQSTQQRSGVTSQAHPNHYHTVPAWWLFIAAVLGCALTVVGGKFL
jgi:carbon monoxide dehydrogenase subunit G